ncbi:MAG TPA: hypothetical protein VHT34_02965 [Clostridia bacterium]|nr:hypothetical protein [Clostridia bacterium]
MDDKFFDLLTIMHNDIKDLKSDVTDLKNRVDSIDKRVNSIDNTVIKMENDNKAQFGALFDGYKQNTEQLNRIEKEVTKHEEFILKRVK